MHACWTSITSRSARIGQMHHAFAAGPRAVFRKIESPALRIRRGDRPGAPRSAMPRRIGRAAQRRRRLPGRNPEGAGAFCAAGSSRGLPVAPGYKAAPRSCPHRKIPPAQMVQSYGIPL